jgi:hypothetical protein
MYRQVWSALKGIKHLKQCGMYLVAYFMLQESEWYHVFDPRLDTSLSLKQPTEHITVLSVSYRTSKLTLTIPGSKADECTALSTTLLHFSMVSRSLEALPAGVGTSWYFSYKDDSASPQRRVCFTVLR